MLRFLAIVAITATIFCSAPATSEVGGAFGPAGVRVVVTLGLELPHGLELRGHFIPAPNLLGELAPLAYVGLHWAPATWFGGELVVGFNWGKQEGIGSLRLDIHTRTFWAWGDVEFRFPSGGWYYFFQAEWQPLRWLAIGGEAEGWGPIGERGSNGGGPNILFGFPPWGHIALAVHFREAGGEVWAEFFGRLIINFSVPRPPPPEPPVAPAPEPEPAPDPPPAPEPAPLATDPPPPTPALPTDDSASPATETTPP